MSHGPPPSGFQAPPQFQAPPHQTQEHQPPGGVQREPAPLLDTPSQTCYVNHIDQKLKGDVLREKLHDAFSKYGTILDVHVRKSYRTRGQAWVTFDSLESAKSAIEALNQTYFLGDTTSLRGVRRPIQVNYSKNKAIAVAKKDGTYKERKREGTDSSNGSNKKLKTTFDKTIPPHSVLLIQHIPKVSSRFPSSVAHRHFQRLLTNISFAYTLTSCYSVRRIQPRSS